MQEILIFFNKHTVLSVSWIIVLVLTIITTFKNIVLKLKTNIISCNEVTRLINRENAVVLDVRSQDDYRKGHIIGSINAVAEDIKKGILNELVKYKTRYIIIVCANGQCSGKLAIKLKQYNFTKVFVLKDGITGWNNENLPLVLNK